MFNICFHSWSNWSDVYFIEITREGVSGDPYNVVVTVQDRTCEKCNKVEARVVAEGDVT